MIYFDQENRTDLFYQFNELRDKNRALYALVHTLNSFLKGDEVVITSIYRDDPKSVHGYWRGVDVRIFHPERNAEVGGPSAGVAEKAVSLLNTCFHYGQGHEVAVIHGEGLNKHIHLQTSDRVSWEQT